MNSPAPVPPLVTADEFQNLVTHTGFVVRQDPDTVRLPDVAYVAAGEPWLPAESGGSLVLRVVSARSASLR